MQFKSDLSVEHHVSSSGESVHFFVSVHTLDESTSRLRWTDTLFTDRILNVSSQLRKERWREAFCLSGPSSRSGGCVALLAD